MNTMSENILKRDRVLHRRKKRSFSFEETCHRSVSSKDVESGNSNR